MSERCSVCHQRVGRCEHDAACGPLCDLLAEARDIIAEHASMGAGIEWMERLHRCPQFKDPDPPQ